MKMVIPGAAIFANPSRLAPLDRLDRCGAAGKAACGATSRFIQHHREAWLHRLEEIALEFLAAIVVIVILVLITEHSHGENV